MTTVRQTSSKRRDNERRNIIIKFVIMIVLGVIIFVLATIAWFAMNTDTDSNGMGFKTSTNPFELSVDSPYALTPDYSGVLSEKFGYDSTHHVTGEGADSIKWLMNDATYDSANSMRGLKPGSHGVFAFNIIPKTAGTYTISFLPVITGYYAEFDVDSETGIIDPEAISTDNSGEYILETLGEHANRKLEEFNALQEAGETSEAALALKESTASYKAANYLNGHILLFEAYDSNSGLYSQFRPLNTTFTKTYTFTQSQVDNATPIPVTFYWVWPNTFGQFILDEGDVNLHDNPMFSNDQTAFNGVTPREELIDYIAAHSGYFFDSSNQSLTGNGVRTFIEGAMGDSPDNLIALSNGYNNADQIMGENIQILLAEMTVGVVDE